MFEAFEGNNVCQVTIIAKTLSALKQVISYKSYKCMQSYCLTHLIQCKRNELLHRESKSDQRLNTELKMSPTTVVLF
jgi:hypothetical protein